MVSNHSRDVCSLYKNVVPLKYISKIHKNTTMGKVVCCPPLVFVFIQTMIQPNANDPAIHVDLN